MRITRKCDEYFGMTWFAVDKRGRVIECTSGSYGYLPEFVCASKENARKLEDFFENTLEDTTIAKVVAKCKVFGPLKLSDYSLAKKGLYSFDANDGSRETTYYVKDVIPLNPLLITQLPKDIADILSNNLLDIDVEEVTTITVEDACRDE